jgi:hypothetical protein
LIKEIAYYVKDNNASAIAVCCDGIKVLKNDTYFTYVPRAAGNRYVQGTDEPKDSYSLINFFSAPPESECRTWYFRSLNYPNLWNVEISYAAKGIRKRNRGYTLKEFTSHVFWYDQGDEGTSGDKIFLIADASGATGYLVGGTPRRGPRRHGKVTDNFSLIVRNDFLEKLPTKPQKAQMPQPQKVKMNRW